MQNFKKIRITQLPKAQVGVQTTDPDDEWIRKIMEYEASKGGYDPSKGAYGLSNWGYNSRNPSSIEEAINFYKQDFLPKVQQYPMGMRERAGDFMYNAGRDPRVYMLDQYLRSIGKGELPNRSSYNIDINKNPSDWDKMKPQFETEWNKYSADIDKLPIEQRIDLLDKGRDFYYQNINRVNNQPNPAYEATWKPRIGIFGQYQAPAATTNVTTKAPVQTQSAPVANTAPPTQTSQQAPYNIGAADLFKFGNTDITGASQQTPVKPEPTLQFKKPWERPADGSIPEDEMLPNDGPPSQQVLDRRERQDDISNTYEYLSRKDAPRPTNKNPFAGFQKAMGKAANIGSVASNTVDALLPFAQYFGDRKRQKDYDSWFRQQKFNERAVVPTSMSGRHGNYAVTGSSYGKFRYPEMGWGNEARYFANPGLRTFQDGGGVISEELSLPSDVIVPETPVTTPVSTQESVVPSPQPVSKGVNPMAQETWDEVSKLFKGVANAGIWGDKKHQTRKSDHNTGDALDIKIVNTNQGNQIAQKLINEANKRNIKYLIFNRRIWNPEQGWRTYTPNASNGNNPHTNHIHVSFNRGVPQVVSKMQDGGVISEELSLPAESISVAPVSLPTEQVPQREEANDSSSSDNPSNWNHYNPGNIHFGDFAKSYGAKPGRKDAGGRVAIFPNIQAGLKAASDLLSGPGYANLTIEEARNKWVTGKTKSFSPSTPHIVRAMGGNKKISELTQNEKTKLIAEFAKWEDRNVYNKLLELNLLKDGGAVLNNNNMKIRITSTPVEKMAYGGQSGYGFDLGQRNTYSKMKENPYEKTSNTIKPVPRDQAVVEAELGETVYGDMNQDGRHELMNIPGKRHTQGGTPLDVPQGSFIYSDTKKMMIKDPEILKMFGMPPSKKGYTPAEISKKYPVNKYAAILQDPNADPIKKRTAELMLESSEKKLAYLALIQESMKGFPQGVPQIAQEILKDDIAQEKSDETRVKAPVVAPPANEQPMPQLQQQQMMPGSPDEQMMAQQAPSEEEMMMMQQQQPPMMYGGEGYYGFGGPYIPDYQMAYGGMAYADEGLEVEDSADPGKKKKYKVKGNKEVYAERVDKVPSGYSPYEGVPNLYWKQTPGSSGTPGKKYVGRVTQAWLKKYNTPEKRAAYNKAKRAQLAKDPAYAGTPATQATEDYVYTEDPTAPPSQDAVYYCDQSTGKVYAIDPSKKDDYSMVLGSQKTYYNSYEEAAANCGKTKEKPKEKPKEEVPPPSQVIPPSRKPFFGRQFAIGPKRYFPYATPLEQYIPDPTFLDPSLALANNAALATTMTRGYTGRPNMYAAAAQAAQMNAIGNAANILGQYDNQNVAIANQFAPLQADILNKTRQYEANRRDVLAYNENMYDKEYRNSLRKYFSDLDKYMMGDYAYYTKRNMLNATNPYYDVIDSPYPWMGGNIRFKPGVSAYNTIIGPGGAPVVGSYNSWQQYQKDVDDLKATGKYSESEIKEILNRKYGPLQRQGSSNSDINSWNRAYIDAMSGRATGYDDIS